MSELDKDMILHILTLGIVFLMAVSAYIIDKKYSFVNFILIATYYFIFYVSFVWRRSEGEGLFFQTFYNIKL